MTSDGCEGHLPGHPLERVIGVGNVPGVLAFPDVLGSWLFSSDSAVPKTSSSAYLLPEWVRERGAWGNFLASLRVRYANEGSGAPRNETEKPQVTQVTANALWEPREASLCPLPYTQLALPRTRDPAHLLA